MRFTLRVYHRRLAGSDEFLRFIKNQFCFPLACRHKLRGGFAELYKAAYGRSGRADQEMYEEMMTILKNFGKVGIHKAVSTIRAESLDALTDALLYPKATKEHRNRLEETLKRKFKGGKGYRFPTPHLVISVRK